MGDCKPIKRESDLSPYVVKWLSEDGYVHYVEFPCYGGARTDIVGFRELDTRLIAIELKITLSRTVIKQAALSQTWANAAYVAVATKPRQRGVDYCRKLGIGVLSCVTGMVRPILMPGLPELCFAPAKRRALELIRIMEPGGVGGLVAQEFWGTSDET